MIRFLRKLLLSLFILLLLVVSGSWLAIHYYGDDIKQLVVQSLNEQLRTKVDVKNVDISFWKNFPKASVLFEDAIVYAVDSEDDTLIQAEVIAAGFNLIELYRNEYKLSGLLIENGSCRMKIDHSGKANYIFWEESSSDSSSNFSIDLQEVELKNINYHYFHQAKDIEVQFFVEEAKLKGNFAENTFTLQLKSTLKNSLIRNADFTFVKDRTLFVYSEGLVDSKASKIEFSDANLGVEGMNFALKGSISYGDNPRLQLDLSSGNTDLEKAIQLLPPKIKKSFEAYKISGKTEISGSINGPLSAIEQPSYQFNFSIKDGQFKDDKNQITFSKSTLKGSISNGAANKAESSQIQLDWFSTELNKGLIEGKLSLENFVQPKYTFNGKMQLQLADAVALFKWEEIKKPEGNITANVQLSGSLESTEKYTLRDWKRSKVGGKIQLQNLAFYYSNGPQHFNKINASFSLQNNNVEVQSLKASVNESSIEIKGKFNNLVGYLLEDDENIMVDANLQSPSIMLEDFLMAKQNSDSTAFQLDISPRLTIYLDAKIGALSFKRFNLKNLSGQFVVRNEQIDARNLSFLSQEGEVEGDLFIRERGNQLNTFAQVEVKSINIKSLFWSFENFGQKTIGSENLKGTASASIDYACVWSKDLKADLTTLKVESNFFIENGELINFKPLESLSKYVELEELKHIRFKNLSNQLLIKDRQIFIPRFDVNSSALNLSLEGKHSFDNEIDYKFTLLLNEILGRKAKKPKSNEFGYVEEDGLGRTKLFLKMSGTVENPQISYDKEQLKTHIKTTIQKEKNEVKQLLNEEFGLFKKDSLVNKNEPKKQSESPFSIEWDETDEESSEKEEAANPTEKRETEEKKKEKKSRFGKFIDKIAEPNEEEYVEPDEKE